jgi:hypothetical protein
MLTVYEMEDFSALMDSLDLLQEWQILLEHYLLAPNSVVEVLASSF